MSTRRHLTAAETAFVAARRLGRLATVNRDGSPQVNPVMVYWNAAAGCIDIGGHNMRAARSSATHGSLGPMPQS